MGARSFGCLPRDPVSLPYCGLTANLPASPTHPLTGHAAAWADGTADTLDYPADTPGVHDHNPPPPPPPHTNTPSHCDRACPQIDPLRLRRLTRTLLALTLPLLTPPPISVDAPLVTVVPVTVVPVTVTTHDTPRVSPHDTTIVITVVVVVIVETRGVRSAGSHRQTHRDVALVLSVCLVGRSVGGWVVG